MGKKQIILLLIGICILIAFTISHNKYIEEYGKSLLFSDLKPFRDVWSEKDNNGKTYKTCIYDMVKTTCTILSKNNISPIIMFGTLLGHKRHNGLIPWDDDVDICVNDQDIDKILGLDEFAKYGLKVKFIPGLGILKVFDPNRPIIPKWGCSWPFIDIYGYVVEGEKVLIADSYNRFILDIQDFLPIKSAVFAKNIPVYVPNNSESVLDTIYGKNWLKECVSSAWNHKDEKGIVKQYKTHCENALVEVNDKIFDNVFVINLDRRPDRWKKTKNRLNNIGIEPNRWSATDGKNDPNYQIYNSNKNISPSEAACFDSHVNLWKYIYDNNIESAIIFEDDIVISPGVTMNDILSDVKESGGFDIFFLGHIYANLNKFSDKSSKIGTALGLHAYIINRKTIEKILELVRTKNKPIDHITREYCKNNLCFLSRHKDSDTNTNPCAGLIHQDFNIDSDLNVERVLRRLGNII